VVDEIIAANPAEAKKEPQALGMFVG